MRHGPRCFCHFTSGLFGGSGRAFFPLSGFVQYLSNTPSCTQASRDLSREDCSTALAAIDWYSFTGTAGLCGSERVGSGRRSEILNGSLLKRFSGAGDCAEGEWILEDSGDCPMLLVLAFLSAGWADFGGLPGPRFSPALTSCPCAIILLKMWLSYHRYRR